MKILLVLFVAVECAKVALMCHSDDIISTIQGINSRFSSETNVFLDFDDFLVDKHFSTLDIPSLVITQQVDFQFIYSLDKDILVVTCISQNSTAKIQSSLSHVFYRMHYVNVLFILLDSEEPREIFEWSWKNGFKDSIVFYCTEEGFQLFKLQPFPDFKLIPVNHIDESSLQVPLTNFYKKPIRTPIANDPPRLFRYVNRQGKLIYSGLFLKLFVLFIEHYNATLEEVFLPDPYPGSVIIPDILQALNEGKIDISAHPLLQRENVYLSTHAFRLAAYQLMVPYSRPVDKFMYFILPFDNWTWIAIIATVFLFAIGIFLGSMVVLGHLEFGSALLQAFSGIINISYNFRPFKSNLLLFIYIALSVVGIMLSNMYLGQLSTLLTTHAYEKQINTIDDVIASKLPITIGEHDKEVYESLGVSNEIIKKIETIDVATWDQQRRILNTSRIDIISEEKYSFFAHQQRYLSTPRVKLVEKPLLSLAPGFALPFTSPYVDMYSVYFQRAIEAGLYEKFTKDLNDDGIEIGLVEFIEYDGPEMAALSLEHFKIIIYLLGGGFSMGAISFALEIAYAKIRRNGAHRNLIENFKF